MCQSIYKTGRSKKNVHLKFENSVGIKVDLFKAGSYVITLIPLTAIKKQVAHFY